MEHDFLHQNDKLIALFNDTTGHGPSEAMRRYENLIFSQQGRVPDEELQVMLDALKAEGMLLEASQDYRKHITNLNNS